MIAVIVPAHDEEARLGRCLGALRVAAQLTRREWHEHVEILVVLDACQDASDAIARSHGVETLAVNARNVGFARAAGARHMLARGARWLACTDADSAVPPDWLSQQIGFAADAVCGTVHVADWDTHHSQAVRLRYEQSYCAHEGHRHIHGANLGICAQAYLRAGGFRPLPRDEDVQLVRDLEQSGAHVVWTARNSVQTSARRDCRARGGFGDFLKKL